MGNVPIINQIENVGKLTGLLDTISHRSKFSKLKSISNQNVLKVTVDTDKKFRRGDVCKIADNVAKEFTGSETFVDDIIPGIVKIGNWQTDGYTQVYVAVGGMDYVYTTEEVNAGDKLFPANDLATPTPIKRFVKKAGEDDLPFWCALEHAEAYSFVKVGFRFEGSGGGA